MHHDVEDYARAQSRRAANRLRGALAKTRARISERPVDDDLLHEQIRARLGHAVSRPAAVEIDVHDGHVVIKGSAPRAEIDDLVDAVSCMHGVLSVDNRLSPPNRGNGEPSAGARAA